MQEAHTSTRGLLDSETEPPEHSAEFAFVVPAFLAAQRLKASASNVGDLGLIPGSGRSLEKEMATHSNSLALRIPWTEELGRPQSMGSQRVRHA